MDYEYAYAVRGIIALVSVLGGASLVVVGLSWREWARFRRLGLARWLERRRRFAEIDAGPVTLEGRARLSDGQLFLEEPDSGARVALSLRRHARPVGDGQALLVVGEAKRAAPAPAAASYRAAAAVAWQVDVADRRHTLATGERAAERLFRDARRLDRMAKLLIVLGGGAIPLALMYALSAPF